MWLCNVYDDFLLQSRDWSDWANMQSNKEWDGDKSTTNRVTRGPKQTKPKQQRLRQRQIYNEQSDSRS